MRPDSIIYAALLTFLPALAGAPLAADPPLQAKPAPELVALEIRVVDEKYLPIHQATVRIFAQPLRVLLTDPAGKVSASGLKPGQYRVNAGKGGYKLEERTVSLGEEGAAIVEFRLKADVPSAP